MNCPNPNKQTTAHSQTKPEYTDKTVNRTTPYTSPGYFKVVFHIFFMIVRLQSWNYLSVADEKTMKLGND